MSQTDLNSTGVRAEEAARHLRGLADLGRPITDQQTSSFCGMPITCRKFSRVGRLMLSR
jgi:hypothetical protein